MLSGCTKWADQCDKRCNSEIGTDQRVQSKRSHQRQISRGKFTVHLVAGKPIIFQSTWCNIFSLLIIGKIWDYFLQESARVESTDLQAPEQMLSVNPGTPVAESTEGDSKEFNVDEPIQNTCLPSVEVSVTEGIIPDTIMEDEPVTYELVQGGTRRGGDLLVDTRGFTYTKKRPSKASTTWWCTIRSKTNLCHATVIEREGRYRRGQTHNHAGDPGALLLRKVEHW